MFWSCMHASPYIAFDSHIKISTLKNLSLMPSSWRTLEVTIQVMWDHGLDCNGKKTFMVSEISNELFYVLQISWLNWVT